MKRFIGTLSTLVVLPWLFSIAQAQSLDPASAALVSKSNSAIDVNSDRYTVRPKAKPVSAVHETGKKSRRTPANESKSGANESGSLYLEPPLETPVKPEDVPDPAPSDTSTTTKRLQNLFLGGDAETIKKYKSFLPQSDSRLNLVEISLAPLVLYTDSNSSSWYRNYNTFAQGGKLNASIWFSPVFGMTSSYSSTFAASMRGSVSNPSQATYTERWVTGGLRFRRFVGPFLKPTSITLGVDYRDHSFQVPADQTERIGYKIRGLALSLESQIPMTRAFSSLIGIQFMPQLTHEEVPTAVTVVSGSRNDSVGYGLFLGGEYLADRTQRWYFKLSTTLEKTVYSGTSSPADPIAGVTLSGVSVLNTLSVFELGFTWGN